MEQSWHSHDHLPPFVFGQWIPIHNQFLLLLSPTIYLCIFLISVKFLHLLQFLWIIPYLPCRDISKDITESATLRASTHPLLLPGATIAGAIHLFLAVVCSAHGEDDHISLVPGRSCEGTERVPSVFGDDQHLLCWLQKPWETCTCFWKMGHMEMFVAQIKISLLSMGKVWFYFTSFWLGLNKTVFYKKTRGISQLKTSLCLRSSILSHCYKAPGN